MKNARLIEETLKEAQWIGKISKEVVREPGKKRPKVIDPDSWRDQMVEHETPSGQVREVKVKTLPHDEQLVYKEKFKDKGDSKGQQGTQKSDRAKTDIKKRDVQDALDKKREEVERPKLDKEELQKVLKRTKDRVRKLKFINKISFEEIRSILASEYMKAGADQETIRKLFSGESGDFKSKDQYINKLVGSFGYNRSDDGDDGKEDKNDKKK